MSWNKKIRIGGKTTGQDLGDASKEEASRVRSAVCNVLRTQSSAMNFVYR